MTSLAPAQSIYRPVFFHNSPSVRQHCELRENEQGQQANLFKREKYICQHVFHIHLSLLSTSLWVADAGGCMVRSFSINNTFSTSYTQMFVVS